MIHFYNENKIPFVLFCVIFISQCLFSQNTEKSNAVYQGKKWLNINYARDTLTGHLMDIYLPVDGTAPYPVIMTIAGSAFFSNDSKAQAFSIGQPLLKKGFAVVAVNHRSSHQAIFPAHVNDIKGALRFIRKHASEYQLDTSFIGIAGNSSGGNLAAMMGTSAAVQKYSVGYKIMFIEGDVGNNSRQSSRVDAVVDWYGPTAFEKMDSCGSDIIHDAADSPESVYIGGLVQENPDLCALANPITYVDKSDPPFLIIHGKADPLVPFCQSVLLYEALTTAGVPCELIAVPDAGHGGAWEDDYQDRMVSFFEKELSKKRKGGN